MNQPRLRNQKRHFASRQVLLVLLVLSALSGLLFFWQVKRTAALQDPSLPNDFCAEPHQDVATPLNDLGSGEYIRMDGTPTGFTGGLYPGGMNVRPSEHEAAGLAIAQQIQPLDADGNPDPVNGKIVMVSVGMSNAFQEYRDFLRQAEVDPEVNSQIKFVNGAQPGQTAEDWADPNAPTWVELNNQLALAGVTPAQVEVAWVKQTLIGSGAFPDEAELLQGYLEDIARNLKTNYPNIKIGYYSSRTRSYYYVPGSQDPEPSAYESGFAVKWLLEQQINGDPNLNYNPANGDVVAPWVSWGPYLWIDGENPRSDGRVWLQEDMVPDCTHPSDLGSAKVGGMMFEFFKYDSTTVGWFLSGNPPVPTQTLTPTATSTLTATPKPVDDILPWVTAPVVTVEPPVRYTLRALQPGIQVLFLPFTSRSPEYTRGNVANSPGNDEHLLFLGSMLVFGLLAQYKSARNREDSS